MFRLFRSAIKISPLPLGDTFQKHRGWFSVVQTQYTDLDNTLHSVH